MKKIYIPHLHYTVIVKEPNKNKPLKNAKAWTQWVKDGLVEMYIETPVSNTASSLVAHELIHVLQYISEDRGIHFAMEREHFGYLMQYLHGEIMGSIWE